MSAAVVCPSCSAENPDSQRFCGACGVSLGLICASCGAPSPYGISFCGKCGSPLRLPTGPAVPAEERRWATVLFADLMGFTAMSEKMDPEDVRGLVDDCLREMGPIVERYGGSVCQIAGDALMALFGAPVAHEDDPERAVRAALEIQSSVSPKPVPQGELKFRIGVNTGEVMFAPLGPDGRREFTAMGDAVNVAARLEQAAPPGGVLVGRETYRATRQAIAYAELDALTMKGKDNRVSAWLAVKSDTGPSQRPLSEVQMVGRERELERLGRIWEGVSSDRRPQLVTVTGAAGVGKTRLFREFAISAEREGARIVKGRSLPYSETAGYGAFAQLIKEVAGIFETDSSRVSERKLATCLARLMPAERASANADALTVLAGLPSTATFEDPQALFGSARELVEGLAREQPTILVFEDIHWADRSLLDLLEWLALRVHNVPALFFTIARPELRDSRPNWAAGLTGYTALPLDPLTAGDAHELAARLLSGRGDPDAAEQVKRKAAGNPLFIEEMVAWLDDAPKGSQDQLPTTVRAIIAARLDALPATERHAVMDASVVGEVFWRGALESLGSGNGALFSVLESLEIRDLIRREPESRIRGDQEYRFKHGLIREVAYGTLPKAQRRQRHRVVAEFIEEATGDSAGSAAMLGHHWREAGDNDRAFEYLLAAAEQATRGWAPEALELYNQALALVPESDTQRHRSVRLKRVVAYQRILSLDVWRKTIWAGADAPEGGPTR